MTADDIRVLISATSLSNREVAAALMMSDDALVRKWKRGDEQPSIERQIRLVDLAASALADQLIRALALAAGGQVESAKLRISPNAISIDGIDKLSDETADRLKISLHARLSARGLKVE